MNNKHLLHPTYRPDIDGLRAVAILSVVFYHAFPQRMPGGFIGVDIFFVISGYLISTILFTNLHRGTFSFSEFYSRRIKRIFPALIVVLVATYAAGWFLSLAVEFQQLGAHMAGGAGFVSNLMLWRESGYFDTAAETKPLLHLWSLGIEEQFYIVWPLLLWVSWKRNFNWLLISVLLAAISLYLNVKGVSSNPAGTFYSPQTRFWELLAGSILAWCRLYSVGSLRAFGRNATAPMHQDALTHRAPQGRTLLVNLASLCGAALIGLGFWRINKDSAFPGWWALTPVTGAFLLIASGPAAWFNRTILSNRVAVWIGLISFPLYLWHWPLLTYARIVEGGTPPRNVRIAAVLTAVVLAWLTMKLVENRIRHTGRSTTKVIGLVVLMSVIGGLGYYTFRAGGLPGRYINVMNEGVNRALSYDWKTGLRRKTCFLDAETENVFSDICVPPRSSKPLLMLWGDSHSASLYRGFADLADKYQYDLAQMNAGGCPPILDFTVRKEKFCTSINLQAVAKIEAVKPDILIMGGYWSLYDGGKEWEKLDTQKLAATVERMKQLGIKHIVLVGSLPAFKVYSANLLRRTHVWSKLETRTYKEFDDSVRQTNAQIRAVAAQTKVDFISPLDLLCNAQGCLLSTTPDEPTPLNYDYGHLTRDGSDYLVKQFFDKQLIKLH